MPTSTRRILRKLQANGCVDLFRGGAAPGRPFPFDLEAESAACYLIRVVLDHDETISIGDLRLLMLGASGGLHGAAQDATMRRRSGANTGLLACWPARGNGLFDRTNVQFVRAGVRVGRVMTGELGSGWARGTFEEDVEIMPVELRSVGRIPERLAASG